MAADPERPPADDTIVVDAEDTIVVDADDRAGHEEEWPLADLYRVEPGSELGAVPAAPTADDAPKALRRFPPDLGPGLLLAIAALLGAIVVGGVVLASRDDGATPAGTQAATQRAPETPASTATTPLPAAKELPDVEGMPLSAARRELRGLGARIRVSPATSQKPAGTVLSQEPQPGAEVERGDVVAVVVARGASPTQQAGGVDVPSVVGLGAGDAVVAIRDAGLVPKVHLVASSETPGRVLRQSPADTAQVPKGSAIRLDVSRARPVAPKVEVPDVVGTSAADARQQLRGLGLSVVVAEVASDEEAGTVLRQSPRAGSEVREHARVTLTVSTGPQKIDIPDVTGLDEDSARQQLEGAGFQVQVSDEPTTDPAQDGLVLSTSPAAASAAPKGSVVTIVVARVG
ncbi:MAG TPA: PASTA domain-containing protein [Gaiellaceae bacterium]|nr:PASTA domain-containing protein [Gaiellaceae bacterium]